MTAIRLDMTMSLDGFVTGPDDRVGQEMGRGGFRLFNWLDDREGPGPNGEVYAESLATGAIISGRRTFELAGPDERPSGSGTVDHHVLPAGAFPGGGGALAHVGVEARGSWWLVVLGDVVGEHEDRDAVVMVAVPAAGKLESPPAGDDRASGHALGVHLAVGARAVAVVEPVEEAEATTSHLLSEPIVRTGDEPIQ